MPIPQSLVCPKCHGPLTADAGHDLHCARDGIRYPLVDDIPSFIIPGADPEALPGCALSLVLPALNEGDNLDRVLPELKTALVALGPTFEIIVVDGGSRDNTQEIVRKHAVRMVTQRLPGFGGAYRAGFEQARGEYVITLDADGSHDPAFLKDLWAARGKGDVVIASRYVEGGAAEMPGTRRVMSRILNMTFGRGLSLPVRDLSSGYRLYRSAILRDLELKATDFDVLEEILIRALAAGYRVHEVPFRYRARVAGQSHARLLRFAVSYLRTFVAMWRLRNSIASSDYDGRAYDSIIPLQRYWQRGRYQAVTRLASGYRRVLDVGCGSSRIIGAIPGMVGLDIQLHKLRYARRYGNTLVHGSIFELPFADGSFDCVICSEVIEHIPAQEKPFDELSRVLTTGGRLILGTPDYDRWRWRALEWLYARLSPGGYADEHITHYTQANLGPYLQGKGFQIEGVEYVGGSEMIFSLKKLAPMASPVHARPVRTALRAQRSVPAA
ncbi:MAG TPA: glycosyltransferase [Candidatus Dormibacteraeota bacterium]|nr:glycosyltransferase [Candidatus Dormibacteraeota bacterium]